MLTSDVIIMYVKGCPSWFAIVEGRDIGQRGQVLLDLILNVILSLVY